MTDVADEVIAIIAKKKRTEKATVEGLIAQKKPQPT